MPPGASALTKIGSAVALGGEQFLEFAAIPQTYSSLLVIGSFLYWAAPIAVQNYFVRVIINDWTGFDYISSRHGFTNVHVASPYPSPALNGTGGIVCEIQDPNVGAACCGFMTLFHGYADLAANGRTFRSHASVIGGAGQMEYSGRWSAGTLTTSPTDPITDLQFWADLAVSAGNPHDPLSSLQTWGAGSTFDLYGIS